MEKTLKKKQQQISTKWDEKKKKLNLETIFHIPLIFGLANQLTFEINHKTPEVKYSGQMIG